MWNIDLCPNQNKICWLSIHSDSDVPGTRYERVAEDLAEDPSNNISNSSIPDSLYVVCTVRIGPSIVAVQYYSPQYNTVEYSETSVSWTVCFPHVRDGAILRKLRRFTLTV